MIRSSRTNLESALGRIKGISDDREIFPDPKKAKRQRVYKKEFRSNSTFVITTHFLKSLLSPAILAMPAGFHYGGLIFSIFGYLFMLAVVSYNMKRLIDGASYLSNREQVSVRTYDEVAYVSFNSCSNSTKSFAPFCKFFINLLFIVTYLDACTIFMLFIARNLEALVIFHYPDTFLNVYHFLFVQVIWLMLMSSIRDLKYLTPFSFISCILIYVAAFLTVSFFFLKNLPGHSDRVLVGTLNSIPRFTSIVSFSMSGISIALTLKSSMLNPERFFSFPGVYCFGLTMISLTFIPFGYLGYLKYGSKTASSIMLNLPLDQTFAICVKSVAIFAIFFASPFVFYVAFNVLWNNYLKSLVNPINVMFAEFFVRYCFIVLSFFFAVILPDLGTMIILKGALLHSHLEITIPAVLDYVTYYPVKGSGKGYFRLIRTILMALFGIVLCVSGTTVAIKDFITSFKTDNK